MSVKNKPLDMSLTLKCIGCKSTKELWASDGPHKNWPMCSRCGMLMLPGKAETKRKPSADTKGDAHTAPVAESGQKGGE